MAAPTVQAVGGLYVTPNNHANPSTATGGSMPSHQEGDVLLMVNWFDTGATTSGQSISTPAGWTDLGVGISDLTGGRLASFCFRRCAGASETYTSPSFAGGTTGTSGATGMSQVLTLRPTGGKKWAASVSAANLLAGSSTATLIASTQNVGAITGFTPTMNDTLVCVFGGKKDDWTGAAALTGDSLTWTERIDSFSTNAGDAAMVLNTAPQTTAAVITSKTFTITGGAAATSAGRMFAITDNNAYAAVDGGILDLVWDTRSEVNGGVLDLVWDLQVPTADPVDGPVLDFKWDTRSQVDGSVLDVKWDMAGVTDGSAYSGGALRIPPPPDTTGWTTVTITADEANGKITSDGEYAVSRLLTILPSDSTDYVIDASDHIIRRAWVIRGGRNIIIKGAHLHFEVPARFFPGNDHVCGIEIDDGVGAVSRRVHLEGVWFSGEDMGDQITLAGAPTVNLTMGNIHISDAPAARSTAAQGSVANGSQPESDDGIREYQGVSHHHVDFFKANGSYESLKADRVTGEMAGTGFRFDHGPASSNIIQRYNTKGTPHKKMLEGPISAGTQQWTHGTYRANFESSQDGFTQAVNSSTLTWPYTALPLEGSQSLMISKTSPGFRLVTVGRTSGTAMDWSGGGAHNALTCLVHILATTTAYPMMRIDVSDNGSSSFTGEDYWYLGNAHPVAVGVTTRLVCTFPLEVLAALRKVRIALQVDDRTTAGETHTFIVDSVASGVGLNSPQFDGPPQIKVGGAPIYHADEDVGDPREAGYVYLKDVYGEPHPDHNWERVTNSAGDSHGRKWDYSIPGYVDDPPPGDATLEDFVACPIPQVMDEEGGVDYISWNGTRGARLRDLDTPNTAGSARIWQGPPPGGDFVPEGIAGLNYSNTSGYQVDGPALDLVWDLETSAVDGPVLDLKWDVPGHEYGNKVLSQSPQLYWGLGESSGQFTDLSGNSRHGGAAGTVIRDATNAIRGGDGSVDLDATGRAEILGYSPYGQSEWSVSGWWKANALATGSNNILFGANAHIQALIPSSDHDLFLLFYVGLTAASWDASVPQDGAEHHYAITFKANDVAELFIDGVSKGTQSVATTGATADFKVGGAGANFAWDGTADEVAVWHRILTSTEIQEQYAAGTKHVDGPSLDLIWDVRNDVNGVVTELIWDTVAQVNGGVHELIWDTVAQVSGGVHELIWDLRASVDAAARTLKWDTIAEVSAAARTLKWDTVAQVNSTVLDLNWDMATYGAVNAASATLKWDTRAEVNGGVLDLLADLRAEVSGAVLDFQWDTVAQVSSVVMDLKWDLVGQVNSAARTLKWDLKEPLHDIAGGPEVLLRADAIQPVPSEDASVNTLPDHSTNGRHALKDGSFLAPTYDGNVLNGKAGLRFFSGASGMYVPSTPNAAPQTIFVVADPVSTTNEQWVFWWTGYEGLVTDGTDGQWKFYLTNNTDTIALGPSNGPHLITIQVVSSSEAKAWLNGYDEPIVFDPPNSWVSNIDPVMSISAGYFDGRLHEFVLFDSILNDTDRIAARDIIASQWGISWSEVDSTVIDLKWDSAAEVNAAPATLKWDTIAQVDSAAHALKWDTVAEVNSTVLDIVWDLQTFGAVNAAPLILVSDLRAEVNGSVLDLKSDIYATADVPELVANPGFETNTTNWTAGGDGSFWMNNGATLTRTTSEAHSGSASGEVVTASGLAASGARYRLPVGMVNGSTYRLEVWLKGAVGGEQVNIGLGSNGNFEVNFSSPITLTTSWQKYTIDHTRGSDLPTGTPSTEPTVQIKAVNAPQITFYVDDLSVAGVPSALKWDTRAAVDGGVLDLQWDTVAQVNSGVLDLVWDLEAEAVSQPVDGPVLDVKWDLYAEVRAKAAPDKITGLALWYDASAITGLSNNDVVATWEDLGPGNRDLIQPTNSLRPIYQTNRINGLPTVRTSYFPGNYLFHDGSSAWITGTQLTAFVVARRPEVGALHHGLMSLYGEVSGDFDNAASTIVGYTGNVAGSGLLQDYRFNGVKSSQTHPGLQVPFIYTSKYNGTNHTAYLNSVAASSVASTGNFGISNAVVGSRWEGSAFARFGSYDYAEIAVFDTALVDADRQLVEAYLAEKWLGISPGVDLKWDIQPEGVVYPEIHTADTTVSGNTASSQAVLTYPANIQAGDILIAQVNAVGSSTASWSGTGFTEIADLNLTGAQTIGWKRAAGTETGTFQVTLSTARPWVGRVMRISGAHPVTAPVLVQASATSTAPNSPALNPATWGHEGTLWLSMYAYKSGTATVTGTPAGYTGHVHNTYSTVAASIGYTTKNNYTDQEDPGAYTISASNAWAAWTLAIRPAYPVVDAAPLTLNWDMPSVNAAPVKLKWDTEPFPFTASVEGLVGWWMADTITGLDDGEELPYPSAWHSHASTPVVANSGATYHTNQMNGLPTVRTSDENYDYTYLMTSLPPSVERTVFVAARPYDVDEWATYWGGGSLAGVFQTERPGGEWGISYSADELGDYLPLEPTGVTEDPGLGYVQVMRYNSVSSADFWHGSSAPVNFDPHTNYSVYSNFGIGVNPSWGSPISADFGEILVFNRALTDPEVEEIRDYLRDKWGLSQVQRGLKLKWFDGEMPLPESGLEMWLKADNVVDHVDGEGIEVWHDAWLDNNDGIGDVTELPRYEADGYQGRPGVSFTTVDGFAATMKVPSITNDKETRTYLLAVDATSTDASQWIFWFSGYEGLIYNGATGQYYVHNVNNTGTVNVGSAGQTGMCCFAITIESATVGKVYKDTAAAVTFDPVDDWYEMPNSGSDLLLSSGYWEGMLHEFAIYDRVLTGPEIEQSLYYLRAKWASTPVDASGLTLKWDDLGAVNADQLILTWDMDAEAGPVNSDPTALVWDLYSEIDSDVLEIIWDLRSSASATIEQSLPTLTQSATAEAAVEGAVAQTLPALTQHIEGGLGDYVGGFIGQTLPTLTQTSTANLGVEGDVTQDIPTLTSETTVEVSTEASITQSLPTLTQSISTEAQSDITVEQTLPTLGQAAEVDVSAEAQVIQSLPALGQVIEATVITEIPVVVIQSGPTPAKISKMPTKDTSLITWQANQEYDAYKVKVVPSSDSDHEAGTQLPTAGGSSNVQGSAANAPANTTVTTTIKGDDLDAVTASDGAKIIKVFVQNDYGMWSE